MSTGQPLPPFRSSTGANYRAFYRAVCDLHERFNAMQLKSDDNAAWAEFGENVASLVATFGGNQFVIDLLVAVEKELLSECRIRENAENEQS